MISMQGIGWITEDRFGSIFRENITEYTDRKKVHSIFRDASILLAPIKNFGRFDKVSRNTCLAISLALFDAGIDYSKGTMQDFGILSTDEEGCLQSNIEYFKDYVECGRKLSRGNLFVYTLPSTPIAEAAINFGCQGPVLYLTFQEDQTNQILEQGRIMIESKEATNLLIVNASEEESICFLLKEEKGALKNGWMDLEEVQRAVKGIGVLPEVIKKILQKDKNEVIDYIS
ncbi:MAG: hypothetical protein P9M07_05805 [Candidatus Aceula meridiana]|nr:hypothetical protein [Candidatus Aceula meridiana]